MRGESNTEVLITNQMGELQTVIPIQSRLLRTQRELEENSTEEARIEVDNDGARISHTALIPYSLIYSCDWNAAKKRFIESKVQFLDQQYVSIDSYLQVFDSAKEKRDVQKSKYNIADGMRQMFDPFERVARAHHICPCCERPFSAEEEDDFVRKQRVKAASSAEHMKVLAVESSNADSYFQQLDKLRVVYEEYAKIGKETIPLAEKKMNELNEELDQKSQALDDVIVNSGLFYFLFMVLDIMVFTC
ncbi:DNA repair protein RAD50-like [Camellia sinensis]|uniref:DNA repair protein RAD50-like n=1 Tax=Camellia sinensis TaxID=4442 RepID=UPI001035CE95|nr:DNA repair protein RAD50-like [Camellia sinensis]